MMAAAAMILAIILFTARQSDNWIVLTALDDIPGVKWEAIRVVRYSGTIGQSVGNGRANRERRTIKEGKYSEMRKKGGRL